MNRTAIASTGSVSIASILAPLIASVISTALPAQATVHDVPSVTQTGTNGCGPAAAASCLQWFKQNGYPDLKTRTGGTSASDFKSQLAKDSKLGKKGAKAKRLRDAMNRLVNEGPNRKPGAHKGQIKARVPESKSAYRDFGFLDTEFSHNENILILIRYKDANGKWRKHYITTRNVTGSGTTRTLEFMDPATGTVKTTTLTDSGKYLSLNYDGQPGRICGFVTMSPNGSTDSKIDDTYTGPGKKIVYTPYFPPHRVTRDLHIWVGDCNPDKWDVQGLPAGWSWKIHKVGRKCYLTIYANGSTNNLTSGQDISVIYKGTKRLTRWRNVIHHTTSGTDSPTNGALPKHNGISCSNDGTSAPIDRPQKVACAVVAASPLGVTAHLSWRPIEEPDIVQYEVYDQNDGYLLATTPDPFVTLYDLETDVIHTFVVAARNADDLLGEDSDIVMVHHDTTTEVEILAGGPQTLIYDTPLISCYDCPPDYHWSIDIPGANTNGELFVTTVTAEPEIAPPPGMGKRHEDMYILSTDAELLPGPIQVTIPYEETEVVGDPMSVRAFALIGGAWMDVTVAVNPAEELIHCDLPDLTAMIAIYNMPSGLFGDFDDSGEVDLADYELFLNCCTGPDMPYAPGVYPPGCLMETDGSPFLPGDFDLDNDIDLADFAMFEEIFGSSIAP